MAILLNYEGVKGETKDDNHKDWIDLVGWTFKTDYF